MINLSTSEYNILRMCHAFTKHLVGTKIFEDAEKALDKNRAFLANKNTGTASHFGTIIPGTIDYTPKKLIISNIITALEKQLVCRVVYKKLMAKKNSVFYIKPLKLFSHKEALYLHAKMAPYPNSKDFSEPEYDPVIAIHRIVGLFITETQFEFPQDYDFDKTFNQHFGIIKDDTFKVTVQFTGFASVYVSERIWSGDQKIEPNEEGIGITFTASSAPEIITWILSFGRDAKVIEPDWLIEDIKEHVEVMRKHYENID